MVMTAESWKAQHWLNTVQKTDLSLTLSRQEVPITKKPIHWFTEQSKWLQHDVALTHIKGEPHKVAPVKLLKDEGKTTREHTEVLDEVLEERQQNFVQWIDTLDEHDLERKKVWHSLFCCQRGTTNSKIWTNFTSRRKACSRCCGCCLLIILAG